MNISAPTLSRIKSSILGICLLGISVPTIGQICSTDSSVAIADGSGSATAGAPATATIEVPAFYTNAITNMTFDLRIDHTYVGDLIATLTSPGGTTVTLMNRPGSPALGIFGCSRDNIDATFDDASGTPVEDECAIADPTIQGVLNPEGALSDFDGETPAGTWTITVTDNAGQDTGTLISASNCLDLTTVPVVLSSFSSQQRSDRILTRWQTSSEAFNLGFNVWGKIDDEWVQLNNRLIASGAVDSVEPLNYKKRFNTNTLTSPPTEIGVSSLSSSGFEEFYGPFSIGEEYGEISVPKAIDWSAQRAKHRQAMQQAGFEWRNKRWHKVTTKSRRRAEKLQRRYPDIWMRIEEAGVYKVSYEELRAQDFDLNGLPIRHLALSHAGKPIARRVSGSTLRPERFGPGSEVIFFAAPPKGDLSRFADFTQIRLSADRSKALNAPLLETEGLIEFSDLTAHANLEPESVGLHHTKIVTFGKPKGYSFIIPGDTPWYDEVVYAFGKVGTKALEFNVDSNADIAAPIRFVANLMGGTSFDNVDADGDGDVEPDHHFKVYLNRDEFPHAIYEGYSEKVDAVLIDASVSGQLRVGDNTIEIDVIPDNGHNLDAAYFLNAQISYQSLNVVDGSNNAFTLSPESDWHGFSGSSLSSIQRVFSYDDKQNFAELTSLLLNDKLIFRAPTPTNNINEDQTRHVWLASESGYLSPTAVSFAPEVDQSELKLKGIDYVIVADPSLIGTELDRYAARQTELGRQTKIISTTSIYANHSDGLPTPNAIATYLKDEANGIGDSAPATFTHVLLVGGHTYNYLGHNTEQSNQPFNLIPSFYRNGKQTINRQIPTAVPFVDFDNDGAPDRAIGRWPVRDLEQLKMVVDKTLAWHADGSHKNNQHTLLLAQKDEELNNFSSSLERLNSVIGHRNHPWQEPERMYFSDVLADETIANDQKLATARQRLIDGINQGPALTVYSGHASPTSWGRENLLTTSVVDSFTNTSTPSLVMPLACYTTYYETPNIKSLSERLFSDNAAGAVGLSGPALLSYSSENERFAKQLLRLMTQQGYDLGTAVMLAKQAFHGHGDRKQTVVYNWVTLADPTLSFNLPAVIDEHEPDTNGKRPNY